MNFAFGSAADNNVVVLHGNSCAHAISLLRMLAVIYDRPLLDRHMQVASLANLQQLSSRRTLIPDKISVAVQL